MARQIINVGTTANDGTGDKLKVAFTKSNDNFSELYDSKEPTIDFGSPSEYLTGDKEWATLNVAAVVGLQTALDAKVVKGGITSSGLTSATGTLIGRATTGTGQVEALDSLGAKTLLGLDNVSNTSDANKPISNATQAALNAKEGSITSGGAGQYWRGDKTFQDLNKSAVGLANVDNTADANKPVFTASTNGIVAAPGSAAFAAGNMFLASNGTWKTIEAEVDAPVTSVAGRTGDITLTKTDVGLANVNNTSDANKPVSTAQQSALNAKTDKVLSAVVGNLAIFTSDGSIDDAGKGVDDFAEVNHTHTTGQISGLADAIRDEFFYGYSKSFPAGEDHYLNPALGAFTANTTNSRARATTAATVQETRNIVKNGTNIGTITWNVGETMGTITIPTPADLVIDMGDFLEITNTGSSTWTAQLNIVIRN